MWMVAVVVVVEVVGVVVDVWVDSMASYKMQYLVDSYLYYYCC